MRWLTVVLVALAAVSGCNATTTNPDFAILPPGCRQPSSCFFTGAACDCHRASLTEFPSNGGNGCLQCDPMMSSSLECTCSNDMAAGVACLEPGQVCVGRGVTCPGFGARCVDPSTIPAGKTACDVAGDPPNVVALASDAGASTEQRCAFVDDVCCAGSSTQDLGVPDLGMPDLAETD